LFFFFFQAEDGIRDYKVTGVQTCALPISGPQLWIRRYRHGDADQAGPAALAVDGSGTVVVTGTSLTFGGFMPTYDYATIAYSAAGVPLWTNYYDAQKNEEDFA